MNWTIIIIIILACVIADKTSTYFAIDALDRNHPGINSFEAEKNPVAKWFFERYGLLLGSALFAVFTASWLLLITWIMMRVLLPSVFLIFIFSLIAWHGFVLVNNVYYYLKYSGIIN